MGSSEKHTSMLNRLVEPLENVDNLDRLIENLADHDWRIREKAISELLTMDDDRVDERLEEALKDEYFGGRREVGRLLSLRRKSLKHPPGP